MLNTFSAYISLGTRDYSFVFISLGALVGQLSPYANLDVFSGLFCWAGMLEKCSGSTLQGKSVEVQSLWEARGNNRVSC